MQYHGYAGNILYVDLSTKEVRREPLDIDIAQKFIGGPGMGARLLIDTLKPQVDPLSAENVLVFGTTPLVGMPVPGADKSYLSTKYSMPATKDGNKFFISHSMFGGSRFGMMMKNAGYDHIVITGRAEQPSYLKVTAEDVAICDASDIWGKQVHETGQILRDRHQGQMGNCGTWVNGPAGDNQVRLALGWSDDFHNAGRFAGAVAGAKNLKAVVTLGDKGIKVADQKRLMKAINRKRKEIVDAHSVEPSPMNVMAQRDTGKRRGCVGGLCACKFVHEVKEGEYKGALWGPMYPQHLGPIQTHFQLEDSFEDHGEAFTLMGALNGSGLCVITCVHMLRLVTDLYERGVLSKDDMGGVELTPGKLDAYLAILDKIVKREDIGAVMAEGWHALCDRVGLDAATSYETGCAISKGVDLIVDARFYPGMYEIPLPVAVQFGPAMGLGAIVSPKTKQTHSISYFPRSAASMADIREDAENMGLTEAEIDRVLSEESFDTGRLEKYGGEFEAACDNLGICTVSSLRLVGSVRDIPWLSEVYSAATGFEVSPRELLRSGERSINLEKLLNVREGFTREDDGIPAVYLRSTEVPIEAPEGDRYLTDWFGRRIDRGDIEGMLDAYYDERGWDIGKGIPTKTRLTELGLGEFADMAEPPTTALDLTEEAT